MKKIIFKKCKMCNKNKSLNLFHKHKKMKDGYLNICAECKRNYASLYREDNIEKVRLYDRLRGKKEERKEKCKIYNKTKRGRESHNKASKKWRENNKLKKQVHDIVTRAIKKGILKKEPCKVCGNKTVQAHHEDYWKPLDVIWLCSLCHGKKHKKYNV